MMMITTLSSSCSLHFALLCIQIGSHIMHARIAKGSHLAPCNLPCLCIQVGSFHIRHARIAKGSQDPEAIV